MVKIPSFLAAAAAGALCVCVQVVNTSVSAGIDFGVEAAPQADAVQTMSHAEAKDSISSVKRGRDAPVFFFLDGSSSMEGSNISYGKTMFRELFNAGFQ